MKLDLPASIFSRKADKRYASTVVAISRLSFSVVIWPIWALYFVFFLVKRKCDMDMDVDLDVDGGMDFGGLHVASGYSGKGLEGGKVDPSLFTFFFSLVNSEPINVK